MAQSVKHQLLVSTQIMASALGDQDLHWAPCLAWSLPEISSLYHSSHLHSLSLSLIINLQKQKNWVSSNVPSMLLPQGLFMYFFLSLKFPSPAYSHISMSPTSLLKYHFVTQIYKVINLSSEPHCHWHFLPSLFASLALFYSIRFIMT